VVWHNVGRLTNGDKQTPKHWVAQAWDSLATREMAFRKQA